MNLLSADTDRSFGLDAALILIYGLTAAVSLAVAFYLPTKWTFFIIFLLLVMGIFSMVREKEKLLFYLSVILTSVFLGFHPVFIESGVFPYPISGFRITIFEVALFFLFLSWMIRLVMTPDLKVRFYPWITIPLLLIWALSLAGLSRVSMPGVIKLSNLWLVLESWLIFLYFANNIQDRRLVFNIVAILLFTGVLQSFLGITQHLAGGALGLQVFGETKSYNVMAGGADIISRVSGTFGHPNNLAGYMVMLVLINLALLWAPISQRLKLLLFPTLLLMSATLILTFSRGGWLALGIGGMVCLYLCFLRWTRHWVISLIIALGLLAVFVVASVGLISSLRQRLFLEDYGAAQTRVPLAKVALNIIYHRPWLGVGLGNYTSAAPDYDISREGISYEFPRPVHNEFLLITAEQGLPALALFLVMLIYILVQLLRLSRSRDDPVLPYLAIGLVGTYVAWCVFRMTDYNYVLLGDPFWLLAGLSLALVQVNRQEAGLSPPGGQPLTVPGN